jgi:dolichyl-phosphate-mannose--protein O-mannosyl transferase
MATKSKLRLSWFKIGVGSLFLLGLFLRFWRLGQFNVLVFDEVYYAVFANNYLIGNEFFNSHPPLSQYLIAIAIWVGSLFPHAPDTMNHLTGSLRSTESYRWINALLGSFVPWVIGAIAYELMRRRSLFLIAMALATFDGLFLVESRYALNNIFLVLFGLIGQWFFLRSVNRNRRLLPIAGLFFGFSAAAKWNGLGFLLGILIWWAIAWGLAQFKQHSLSVKKSVKHSSHSANSWLKKLASVSAAAIALNLLFIPALVYSLLWIPHLLMNPEFDFWEVNQQIFTYHQSIGSGKAVHPYCSPWYSWLLMTRPMAYYYDVKTVGTQKIVQDVHAMANPFLLWLSTAAIALTLLGVLTGLIKCWRTGLRAALWRSNRGMIYLYFLSAYTANLLPWLEIKRCTFIYHYLAAYSFALLSLAWWLDLAWRSPQPWVRRGAIAIMAVIIGGFIYWLPVFLGISLKESAFQHRMWFESWI